MNDKTKLGLKDLLKEFDVPGRYLEDDIDTVNAITETLRRAGLNYEIELIKEHTWFVSAFSDDLKKFPGELQSIKDTIQKLLGE